jgi:hypothetical protein
MPVLMPADIGYINLVAGKAAADMLMRGLHERSRPQRPHLRSQAGHRRRPRQRPAHLAIWSDDFAVRRARRFPYALRSARCSECFPQP